MKKSKRLLSMILVLLLCLSMLPVSALALDLPELDVLDDVVAAVEEEEEPVEEVPSEEEVEEPIDEDLENLSAEELENVKNSAENINSYEELVEDVSSEKKQSEEENTLETLSPIEDASLKEIAPVLLGASASQITSQISNTYSAALKKTGRSSFNGYCGLYVNWQLVVLGINTSYVSGDGNKQYDNYKNLSKSSGGYPIAAYPASTYSLKDALNKISSNGTKDVYNILVGFEKGSSSSDGQLYGHTVFIHAIIDGQVYFSESFGVTVGGSYYSEGKPIICSITTFCNYYNGWTTQLDGVIHFKPKDYVSQCESIPTYLTVEVAKATTLKKYPCAAATDASSTNIAFPSIGDTFDVYAMWENTEGNYWYEVKYNGSTCYLFSGDTEVTKHRTDDITISSVSAPSSVTTGNDFTLAGLIASNYNTIGTIQGYIVPGKVSSYTEGTAVQKVNRESLYVKAYEIKNSAIDIGLTFETLSPGTYTYCVNVVTPNYYSSDGKAISTYWAATEVLVQSFTVQSAGATSFKITFDANGGTLPTAVSTYKADGVNVSRGDGMVVIYNQSGSTVATNAYGVEAVVNAEGKITSKRAYLSTTQVTVPIGGMVISGHAMWVNDVRAECLQFVDSLKVGQYASYDSSTRIISVYDTYEAYLAGAKYVKAGGTYGTLPTPTRSGYTFDGWYTAASGGTKITSSSTYTTQTLYAHWTHQNHSYSGTVTKTVTCEEDGKTTFTCPCGDSYVEVVPATGHVWDAGKVTTAAGPGTTGVKTYTCGVCGKTKTETIAALPKEYTISFDANGGSGAPAAQTKTHNITMTLSSIIPVRNGYTFLGWATSKTATSAEYKAGVSYTGNANATLYAVWKEIPVEDEKTPQILVSSASAAPGGTAEITVSLQNNPGIASFELEVTYDKTKLKWIGITQGDMEGNWDVAVGENALWVNAEDYNEDGVILTLTFEVLEGATGESSVSVAYDSGDIFDVNEKNISFEVVAGTIAIKGHVPGDVNNDGVTNNKDLLRLMKYLKGKDVEVNKVALDINGDGSENNKDLLRLMKYLKGKDVEIY